MFIYELSGSGFESSCSHLNLCCLLIFNLCKDRKKPGLYLQKARNTLASNQQLFCQQSDKNSHWLNELLNTLFNKWSYKNSCFSELAWNSSALVLT